MFCMQILTLYAFSDGCRSKNSKNVLYAEEKCNNCVFVHQVCRPYIVLYLNGHMQCANNWMPIFCRDILVNEGIWDMVHLDHGTEACLMLFVQDYLENH